MEVQLRGNADLNPVNPFPDPNTYAAPAETAKSPTAPAAAAPATAERPAWLPAKFKTPEDLAASYAALEMRLGQPAAPAAGTPPAPGTPPAGTPPAAPTPPAVTPLTDADLQRYSDVIVTNGALAPEHYAELAAKGIPRAAVDTYVAGQQAVADSLVRAAYDEAGGKEQYHALATWAKEGLAPEVFAQVKAAFASNDRTQILGAVKTMKAMHAQSGATLPPGTRATGTNVAASQYPPIQSTRELTMLMKSYEYKNDPAFRDMVAKRLEHSNL